MTANSRDTTWFVIACRKHVPNRRARIIRCWHRCFNVRFA